MEEEEEEEKEEVEEEKEEEKEVEDVEEEVVMVKPDVGSVKVEEPTEEERPVGGERKRKAEDDLSGGRKDDLSGGRKDDIFRS